MVLELDVVRSKSVAELKITFWSSKWSWLVSVLTWSTRRHILKGLPPICIITTYNSWICLFIQNKRKK